MMWIALWAGCLVDEPLYREVKADFADADGDGLSPRDGDCDDGDPLVAAGRSEVCDTRDNDCDGLVDNDPVDSYWYIDADGDGFGDSLQFEASCDAPAAGYTHTPGDCADDDPEIHPGATEACDPSDIDEDCDGRADNGDEDAVGRQHWYVDADADGFGDDAEVQTLCDQPAGYSGNADDCDDTDDAVWPGQEEVCNGVDDDCDGQVDVDPTDGRVFFADADGDGYGDPNVFVVACDAAEGYVDDGTDCDDTRGDVNPGVLEICDPDQRDEDCDTFVDDGDSSATGQDVFFGDTDGDGHGVSGTYAIACDPPLGFGVGTDDCDDADATRYPGAPELCDDTDSDCDGSTDDDDALDALAWYVDADGDGYGDAVLAGYACLEPAGASANAVDCDDADPGAWPGAPESCNGVDDDCSGLVDDGAAGSAVWFLDEDGDGWGAEAASGCPLDARFVEAGGDCDDGDPGVSPEAAEVCSGAEVDEDCDGFVDDGDPDVAGGTLRYADADGDGHGAAASGWTGCRGGVASGDDCDDGDARVSPGQFEVCNGVDDDCDGTVDVGAVDGGGGSSWADLDGDGVGGTEQTCSGGVAETGDCDDSDATVYPGAPLGSDGRDHDCDGAPDAVPRWTGELTTADAEGTFDAPAELFFNGSVGYLAFDMYAWRDSDIDGDGLDDILAGGIEELGGVSKYAVFDGFPSDVSEELTRTEVITDARGDEVVVPTVGGDFNADGVRDFVVAVQEMDDVGSASVLGFSGWPTSDRTPAQVAAWGPAGSIAPSQKYAFETDFDADGATDIALLNTGWGATSTPQGHVRIWRGPEVGELYDADVWMELTGDAGDGGFQAGSACDLDGDGIDELFLGQSAYADTATAQGRILGFEGPFGGTEVVGDADFRGMGPSAGAAAGAALWCMASLSGDGTADLFVGATGSGVAAGRGFVLAEHPAGDVDLSAVAWLELEDVELGSSFGASAREGDIDADGQLDLVVGAPDRSTTIDSAGALYGFYAPSSGLLSTADAAFTLVGDVSEERIGSSFSVADINGDGDDDLLVNASGPGAWSAGGGRAWYFPGGTR